MASSMILSKLVGFTNYRNVSFISLKPPSKNVKGLMKKTSFASVADCCFISIAKPRWIVCSNIPNVAEARLHNFCPREKKLNNQETAGSPIHVSRVCQSSQIRHAGILVRQHSVLIEFHYLFASFYSLSILSTQANLYVFVARSSSVESQCVVAAHSSIDSSCLQESDYGIGDYRLIVVLR